MRKLLISLFIGAFAGTIDIIPMLIQNMEWNANLSAFVFWLVMSVVINYSQIQLRNWLKGLVIAVMCSLPIVLMLSNEGFVAVLPIIFMSALLGSFVGYYGERYAHNQVSESN